MVAIILLGAIVFMRNPKQLLNRSFFALSLAATTWILTNLIFALSDNQTVQYVSALLSYGAAGLIALFFLQYSFGMANINPRRLKNGLIYGVGLAVSVTSVVPGVLATKVVNDTIATNVIPLIIYGSYIFSFMIIAIVALLLARARSSGMERNKITIVLMGLVLAAIVGVFCNLILPIMGNYSLVEVGPVATLIFVATSTYAIIRHRLFDIKLAAVRSAAYVLSLGSLALIYYFLAYFFSVLLLNGETTSSISLSPVNVVIALGLAFIFQYIKRFFDRVTNSIFYRDSYDSEAFFGALSNLLSSTTDLRGLLERASKQIASTFKSEQALFFIYYKNRINHHMSAGTYGHTKMPVHDARTLDNYVENNRQKIFLTDTLPESDNALRRMLLSHRIGLVMPLWHEDQILGYLLLGDHQGGRYNKHDLNVLTAISSELVIAIQNALTLHEIKELNATLQQRIDVATKELRASNNQLKHLDEIKDEFISMASHQLRTPLTSVKGYLSMLLDGDAGKVTPRQQKLMLEAFNSSERMVRLIADFLNVSRLQSGKFLIDKELVDFRELVKQEVSDLELIAKTRNIKFRTNITKQELPLMADKSKIQQVVMNFIDNAIYYSHPKSTVIINLEKVKHNVAFTVVDTGIGVPEDEQSKLFHKFFRAKNARKQRPDGTGVGIYMARRVVEEHGGKIIFSSREGRGSTFGFSIPIVEDEGHGKKTDK